MMPKYRSLPTLITAALLFLAPMATAQDDAANAAMLTVGDPAPPLVVEKFVKGQPVNKFETGRVYVIEFWATWCAPCRASMPHLTDLQKKWQDKVTVIGVNIWEERRGYNDKTLAKVEKFVKDNAAKMDYTVAFDGAAKKTDKAYMQAAGQRGIPASFVVSPDGRIAFIGDPRDEALEQTVEKLLKGEFDLKVAADEYKQQIAEEIANEKIMRQVRKLLGEAQLLVAADKIDEALAKIDEAGALFPEDRQIQAGVQKFTLLIRAEKYDRAYAIAAELVDGPGAEEPGLLNAIAWSIVDPSAEVPNPDLKLAARAAEKAVKLTEEKDPSILDTFARCCWLQGDKARAVELQTKAVELCADAPGMRAELQKTLDEYKQ